MRLLDFLMVKAVEEAIEISQAATRCLLEGITNDRTTDEDDVDPTPAEELAEEVGDYLTFVKLIAEEGVVTIDFSHPLVTEDAVTKGANEIRGSVGENPTTDALIGFLLIKLKDSASSMAKAFTKMLTFGPDSVDPRTTWTSKEKVDVTTRKCLFYYVMLREELMDRCSITLPAVGDEAYMAMRYKKAIDGANQARKRGIITDLVPEAA